MSKASGATRDSSPPSRQMDGGDSEAPAAQTAVADSAAATTAEQPSSSVSRA